MADFGDFDSSQAAEEDPAAEFLAREQSELAGLEDFDSNEAVQVQDGGFDTLGEAGQGDSQPVDQFGGGGSGDFGEQQTNGPSDMYSAISQQDTVRPEPEKIRIWREEQAKRLAQKGTYTIYCVDGSDEEEEKTKEEWRSKAKKELDDWYKHHAEQLEKTRENNRAAEEAFIKDRDEKVPGQAWEKITRLCEFNPKNSKNTKDVSRLRSILLQLKQTPLVR